jgi:hypothetical protein
MYDNLMSGVYSILEINVGIICICMPAFRRFLAGVIPTCFESTQENLKDRNYPDRTPIARVLAGKMSGRKKSTFNNSLFETGIMRTVDLTIESRAHQDDEVCLVELKKPGKSVAESTGSNETHDGLGLHPDPCLEVIRT